MISRLINILNQEDPRKPYTDMKLAELLNISRDKVTETRALHDIPDSRERRKRSLMADTVAIIKEEPTISERQLCKRLCALGYNISRHIAANVKNEALQYSQVDDNEGSWTSAVVAKLPITNQHNAFKGMIGNEGSLRTQISQAKAAVFYPPHGLHTLLLGPSGAGKNQLAEAMYHFAVSAEIFPKKAPFILFNCADYADNPQLLLSQLFGHEKGAFTGATTEKTGLVEKADCGILFLDELHRLPKEGQEILFSLLDRGTFRRLGETESSRKSEVMIIAATTENPESSLLLTLRRRIPMVISLPSLKERPITEVCEIIRKFFMTEALRIGKPLVVKANAVKALMLYEYPGNVGQLRSDIQVACARSLLSGIRQEGKEIVVKFGDLPEHIQNGLLTVSDRNPTITTLVNMDMKVDINNVVAEVSKDNRYILPIDIYQFIEERYLNLNQKGLSQDEIKNILAAQVDNELKKFVRTVNSSIMAFKDEVACIVGEKIAKVVSFAVEMAKKEFPLLRDNIFSSLAIHLYSAYNRLKSGKPIRNPKLSTIINEHPAEYKVAVQMAQYISTELQIEVPEDESGFIALYIHAFLNKSAHDAKVGVVVITHGTVAAGMADVANKLLGVNHAIGIEMDLNEKPVDVLQKVIEVVERIDQGKGCLFLVDLGSLATFGEIIMKRTGIPIRTVSRVDTVMVLEAVRRAMLSENSLTNIADELADQKAVVVKYDYTPKNKNPRAILSICITGEGTSDKLKKYVEKLLPNINAEVQIIPLGVMNECSLNKQIAQLKGDFEIVAAIGTMRPEGENIPFITLEEILSGIGLEKIREISGLPKSCLAIPTRVMEALDEELIFCRLDTRSKNDTLDYLVEMLEHNGYVDPSFMLSVYKREALGTTAFEGRVAIPHGDPKYVTKSTVAIATLPEPVEWQEGIEVQIVFLFALKEDGAWCVDALYNVMKSPKCHEGLKCATNKEQVINIIRQAQYAALWENMG